MPLSSHSLAVNSSKNWYASSTNIVLFKEKENNLQRLYMLSPQASLMTPTQSVQKIMKALNDYKPTEKEWSIHAKNYSNTEKQNCPYLAGILQAKEQRQRQRQRQKQNSNDMIHIG